MFSECSNGSCGPGRIWWSFQMKVWTLKIQRNSMILTIPWSPAIQWSIGSMDYSESLLWYLHHWWSCIYFVQILAYLHQEGRVALTSPSFIYLFFVPPWRHFPTPANCFPSKCSPEKGNFLLPLHFVFFSVPLQIFPFFILSKVVC